MSQPSAAAAEPLLSVRRSMNPRDESRIERRTSQYGDDSSVSSVGEYPELNNGRVHDGSRDRVAFDEDSDLGEDGEGEAASDRDDSPSIIFGGHGAKRPGIFVWGLTVCAGVSGLLFGYDTGVISSTLISINTDLSSRPLTTLDKSLITSCTSFFALLASPLTGLLADSWGRKKVILIADILFILGALFQAFTTSVSGMILGRSIVGAAVGSASFVVPLYISELSPSQFRGRLVTVASLFITGGQVVAYIIGWIFSTRLHGWRWMVGLGALPAAIQFLMLFFMPETPRWLVRVGRKETARRILERVYERDDDAVRTVLRGVEREVLEEEEAVREDYFDDDDALEPEGKKKNGLLKNLSKINPSLGLLISVGGNRRALAIACMLQGFQQLCGFNSLMYFSATIFSLVGFRSPTLTSLSIALTNFAFTLVAFHAIDRVGRRRILLWSVPVMIIGLALCAVAFAFVEMPGEKAGAETIGLMRMVVRGLTVGLRVREEEGEPVSSWDGKAWPLVILMAMIMYVAGYAIGMGNVPWQQSELFPLPVRALGSALATATNWASNTLIGLTFLPMMQVLTPTGTFVAYALVCCVAWVTIYRIYPETAGLGLEEVGELLREGWGVGRKVGGERRRGGDGEGLLVGDEGRGSG